MLITSLGQTLPVVAPNRLSSASPKAEVNNAEKAPAAPEQPDLLSLSSTPSPSRWNQTFRSAGRVFLRFGLSALAGALLGPLGVAAGAIVGGAQTGITQGRKTGLMAGGLSAAVGLAGMALGPAGGALLALGSLALGAWHGSRVRAGDDPKDAELTRIYANAYLEETRAAMAGQKAAKRVPQPLATGRSKKAVEAAAAHAVFQACQLAATNLPSAVGLSIAGKAAHRMFKDQDLKKLDETLLKAMPPEGEQPVSDNGLATVRYAKTGLGPAVAAISTVVVDPEFAKAKDAVTMDFVIGHELSHIRHKDAVSKIGQLAFSSLINSLAQQESDPIKKLTIATTLAVMSARQSRDMEFRADREGVDYALSKGHSREAIEKAASALFTEAEAETLAEGKTGELQKTAAVVETPADSNPPVAPTSAAPHDATKLLDTHPPNVERVQAVQKHLSERGAADGP